MDLGLENVFEDVKESERKARERRPFLCGGEKVNDSLPEVKKTENIFNMMM